MGTISFNSAMLAAVRAGTKTVTRRRLPAVHVVQQEPERYRVLHYGPLGVVFADVSIVPPAPLPPLLCPFGTVGTVLQVLEDPALRLRVTRLRVEPVRCLTPADAQAEGVQERVVRGLSSWGGVEPDLAQPGAFRWYPTPVAAFRALLASIYPTAWARNEWVWVVEFQLWPAEATEKQPQPAALDHP
jgi:hypothetical protein